MDNAEFRLRDVHIFALPVLMSLQQFYPFDRRSVWLLCGMGVLHGLMGAAVGLSVDEAHYLLYALHPALSYFDHPPLVGWLQWPGVALDLPTVLLRLLPGALWLATAAGCTSWPSLSKRMRALDFGPWWPWLWPHFYTF